MKTRIGRKNTYKVDPREHKANGNVHRRILILDGSHSAVILAEQVPLEPQRRRLRRDEFAVEASATAQPQESQDNQRHRDLQPHAASIFPSFFRLTTRGRRKIELGDTERLTQHARVL